MKFLSLLYACFLPIIGARTIMLGDSLFYHPTIQNQLQSHFNVSISNFAQNGASFQSGWVQSIPEQYDQNDVQNTTLVVMDGGGNDIFSNFNDCLRTQCPNLLDTVMAKIESLFQKMIRRSVQRIIFMGPFYIQILRKTIDEGVKRMNRLCHQYSEHCVFVDVRNLTIPLSLDGRHPTEEGYRQMATQIINTIISKNITLY